MKNNYEIRGNVTAIFIDSPKYGKMETLISTKKLKKALGFSTTWIAHYHRKSNSFYVSCTKRDGEGIRRCLHLHRFITDAKKGLVVDHINHDTLNNTDKNLRVITCSGNSQNRKGPDSKSTSGVRGVSWYGNRNKWLASFNVNKKRVYVGLFDNVPDAEKAVKKARKSLMPYSKDAK